MKNLFKTGLLTLVYSLQLDQKWRSKKKNQQIEQQTQEKQRALANKREETKLSKKQKTTRVRTHKNKRQT